MTEPDAPRPEAAVEAFEITKRFGAFTALEKVSIRIERGEVHALLGENGAGKSTLVKCIIGYQGVDEGAILVDGIEREMANPRDAHKLGIGMVYQHFTLVPSMTVAENLVMSRVDVPTVIDWRRERAAIAAFLERMPFQVPLDQPVERLSAGERQKTEILKQLYLDRRVLILDEPTSVLTPDEADEVLTLLGGMARDKGLSILMITHKFREVTRYADRVTILRRGRLAGSGLVAELSTGEMAAMMVGATSLPSVGGKEGVPDDGAPVLSIRNLKVTGRTGLTQVDLAALDVYRREIVGIAGISGNGQKELVEVLAGQRLPAAGAVLVHDTPYGASRAETRAHKVRLLPEEPLKNACAPRMSVAENLAFRIFDETPAGKPAALLDRGRITANATDMIAAYKVKTSSPQAAIATLSGGNVQRAVLAREFTGEVDLLIVANPCFGLDFAAVAEIRSRIVKARNGGAAVLLVSEDLDELIELADRILVMSEGKIAYETQNRDVDIRTIGAHMAGHH
ncbi:ABC transporter ATP-binding protein [Oleomonas cavernae]|uniref:ABC transporter ATP-binding protein n=1 Tax=Oleomonas cavernae TaxID=2320859 RepID=A0A418WBH0_9PROT|nr:ABC transporter ATP-binding protein [Oleomonas cavernae]RJF87296.1 ABC transporter ATP-binding protein [Oleomonas cavernae]